MKSKSFVRSAVGILTALVGVLMACGLLLTVAACASTEKGEPHEHTYATVWSSDQTSHWHAATCEHTSERKDVAPHTFEGNVCTVCFYEKKGEVSQEPELEFALNAEKTAYSLSGIGTVTEVQITVPAEYKGLPVTSVGNEAFKDNAKITDVVLPDSVTSVGDYAFSGCSALESVSLSENVTSIGDHAFDACGALGTIELPAGLSSIGQYAFQRCTSLKSIRIPAGVSVIEAYTFTDCSVLAEVEIAEGVREIADHAFFNCAALTFIDLPDSVESIDQAFIGCSALKSVKLGSGIATIGKNAFRRCTFEKVYYNGTEAGWSEIDIDASNTSLMEAPRYYYSETEPATDGSGAYVGNWWHYVDGVVTVWQKSAAV